MKVALESKALPAPLAERVFDVFVDELQVSAGFRRLFVELWSEGGSFTQLLAFYTTPGSGVEVAFASDLKLHLRSPASPEQRAAVSRANLRIACLIDEWEQVARPGARSRLSPLADGWRGGMKDGRRLIVAS